MNALSLTLAVNDWLTKTRRPRILHIFDHACNLINEHREVLSIVTPRMGNGPFNLVVEEGTVFSEHLNLKSLISNSPNQLVLGDLIIPIDYAKRWSAKPDWENLHAKRNEIAKRLTQFPINDDNESIIHSSGSFAARLSLALANADISAAKDTASKLAGLGIGLTPSGDDFIMGALYASWIIHPHEIASILTREIAETAASVTTSLSAAWIRSAGRGEAGILWHEFFDALIVPVSDLQSPIDKILSTGHTSGADALAGFFSVLAEFKERIIDECPS
jgi:hypothetical protein